MSSNAHKKARLKIPIDDIEIDLVPMIDVVFLLLLFFMLCGHITLETRVEQITVPPTKTGQKLDTQENWERIVVNVYGSTASGNPPRNTIRINNVNYVSSGIDSFEAYQKLRQVLDQAYDRAEKFPDPKNTGFMLPKVVLEIRADADTEYRVVQEVQQVVSGSINPFDAMKPMTISSPAQAKPFVFLNFTTRKPGDK
ncbi:MAG: biopolymer transporter ExbD [Planctomycetes bacterium]|nr:biopolymer transporter ExbD [Planctomycetota bacterium]